MNKINQLFTKTMVMSALIFSSFVSAVDFEVREREVIGQEIIGQEIIGQGISSMANDEMEEDNRWVVVLKDPRPARLKGWRKRGQYRSSGQYEEDLALKRLSKDILKNLPVELVAKWPIKSINVHCLIIRIPSDKEEGVLKRLSKEKRVKWVQKYQFFRAQSTNREIKEANNTDGSPDPYLNLQPIFDQLNLHQVSQLFNGKGVDIAMIDSGVDATHPELIHALVEQIDFVDGVDDIPAEHHGTGIAGVMVARNNNGTGIAGISPEARLFAYRSCWESDSGKTICDSLTLARALDRVAQIKPTILNLSLTGPKDRLLESILKVIVKNGTQIITAYDVTRNNDSRFPMSQKGVIMIQDTFDKRIAEKNPSRIHRDNASTIIHVPGKEVLTTQPGDTYAFMSGSSMAAAHFTGVLAIIAQAVPGADLSVINPIVQRFTGQANGGQYTDVCRVLLALGVRINCKKRSL